MGILCKNIVSYWSFVLGWIKETWHFSLHASLFAREEILRTKTRKILDKFHCPLYRHSLIRFTPCYRSSKSRIMGLESFDLTGSSFIATMGQYFAREKNPFNAKNPFNVSSFSIKMNGVNAYYLTPNSWLAKTKLSPMVNKVLSKCHPKDMTGKVRGKCIKIHHKFNGPLTVWFNSILMWPLTASHKLTKIWQCNQN